MRVAIAGLGLVGASLGLALARAKPGWALSGWDRDPEAVATALARGAIGAPARDLAALADADAVVLAVPVMAMRQLLIDLAPHLQPGTLVTDVASTKEAVVAWAEGSLPAGVPFVGGHPMAGGTAAGAGNARADLFEGAVYCLTPAAGADDAAVAQAEAIAIAAGARPLQLDAARHDAWVARVSHVPFAAAAALVLSVADAPDWPEARRLAATGFRDATRLASGDVAMHRDICLSNGPAVAAGLRALAERLVDLARGIDDPAFLEATFAEAKTLRDAWLLENERLRPPPDET